MYAFEGGTRSGHSVDAGAADIARRRMSKRDRTVTFNRA